VKSIKDFLNELPDEKPVFVADDELYDIEYIDNDNDRVILKLKRG
jgi:hypothetical protein